MRLAALTLDGRVQTGNDQQKIHLAWLLSATAELRLGHYPAAERILDGVDAKALAEPGLAARVWLERAEIARHAGDRARERYALLLLTRTVPLDSEPPLRADVGRAWQRLYELNGDEGNEGAAEVCLTHALRCSSERADELMPLWDEIGARALATRGAGSPYVLYQRAKNEAVGGQPDLAPTDARAPEGLPGTRPALEVVSRAADDLRDYPLMISASLEMMERGWTSPEASARLRRSARVLPAPGPRALDADGSARFARGCRALLAKGDLEGAALAARGGRRRPAARAPPALARVELDAGEP